MTQISSGKLQFVASNLCSCIICTMIGLYVHIPFCHKKCHYCNFVITGSGSESKHAGFLDALTLEMASYREKFQNTVFDTLYLGGGTPSALRPEEMERLFGMIRGNFKIKEDAEITMEANPKDLDPVKTNLFQKLGVNRVSLGAQSFHDKTLKAINRDHTSENIFRAVEVLRKSGIQNISCDLILSLPGETLQDVQSSVRQAVDLGFEHFSIYELTIEEKTVFGERHKKGELRLPDEEEQLVQLTWTREFLKNSGYEHYELLSYAKPGFQSRHNRLYWENEEYLGLGPGACSYIDGRRYQIAKSYEEYMEKAKRGDWISCEDEKLQGNRKEIESLLLALRLTEGADIRKFAKAIKILKDDIEKLKGERLLENGSHLLRLTPRGQLFAETVFSELC